MSPLHSFGRRSRGDKWNHERGKERKKKRWWWGSKRARESYKDKVPQVLKNTLHASAIIPLCLSPVSKQTGEPPSPGILICSPNVLWQRNWSHFNTNKLDLTAHLQCKTCLQVWEEWPPPKKAEQDTLKCSDETSSWWSGFKGGVKKGRKAVYDMYDWWLSDEVLSAAVQWIWIYLSDMIAVILS